MRRTAIRFWLLFFFLNFFYFLPGYLINAGSSDFIPVDGFLHGNIYERLKSVFVRHNYDIFRLNVDLLLLVAGYYLLKKRISPARFGWFAGAYYVLTMAYLAYFVAFEKIYMIPPLIYNDISLLKLGIVNTMDGHWFRLIMALILVSALAYGIIFMVRNLILYTHDVTFKTGSYVILSLLFMLVVINTAKSGLTWASDNTVHASFAMMSENMAGSAQARKNLAHFNVDSINERLHYDSFQLRSKPDIYLLFIESYGTLLYEDRYLRAPYIGYMDSCEKKLKASGWKSATGFSTSPVSGGQSWISYTSVMFGYNIRNQGTYNSMLKDTSMARYGNLFRVLKQYGYTTFRLNAMPQNPELEVPWKRYSDFYAIDHWINFPDFHYTGRLYGFGPSPPDQFSINFAEKVIHEGHAGPSALFFITQTTHNPFYSPANPVNDWRTLNRVPDEGASHASVFLKKPRIEDYARAVRYDITTLVRFIVDLPDTNAIFILIGDHQPPYLTRSGDGFETPVHIIGRNSEFVSAFQQYGFSLGMTRKDSMAPLRHEAIYSMFMREFIRLYGYPGETLPEYLPEGINSKIL